MGGADGAGGRDPSGSCCHGQLPQIRRRPLACRCPSRCGPRTTPIGAPSWPRPEARATASTSSQPCSGRSCSPWGSVPSRPSPGSPCRSSHPMSSVEFTVDSFYSTASVPATMPLLFLLACWGIVVAVRRRSGPGRNAHRIPLLVTIVPILALLVYGYIAPRYLADFLPFLILGSAIGMIDLWRHLAGRGLGQAPGGRGTLQRSPSSGFVVNAGIASVPASEWTTDTEQRTTCTLSSWPAMHRHSLADQIVRELVTALLGATEPGVHGRDCAGLYLSNGSTTRRSPPRKPSTPPGSRSSRGRGSSTCSS